MTIKEQLKLIFKKTTGLFVYKYLPLGVDPFYDIKQRLQDYNFNSLIDVGANIGQTAKQMRDAFPNATIHSIEPVKKTFNQLQQNLKGLNVTVHNLALGSKNEAIEIKIDESSTNSSINSLVSANNENITGNLHFETINVLTAEDFFSRNKINHVDYMKIDTEGYDLEVIKGADKLLAKDAISFIEAEVSMNPGNTFHVSFEEVKKYLEQYNYRLFGLYEQVHEWKVKSPVLRRCNALFISGNLAKKYTKL